MMMLMIYRRGSNVSLHDGGWSSGGSDIKSLSMFSRSKSSSASNLGPASLQLGVRGRHRQEEDNCSEVSSTTSGYTSGRGQGIEIECFTIERKLDSKNPAQFSLKITIITCCSLRLCPPVQGAGE